MRPHIQDAKWLRKDERATLALVAESNLVHQRKMRAWRHRQRL